VELTTYKTIGIIHTPFSKPEGTPIQPTAAKDVEGFIELFPDYLSGLQDLQGFSHIFLLYRFHLSKASSSLLIKPFLDDSIHGVFATRAPSRPNPIGLSIVRLEKIEISKIYVKDVDIVDGTPLLDIKPYINEFDFRDKTRIGWMEKRLALLSSTRDDGRFSK